MNWRRFKFYFGLLIILVPLLDVVVGSSLQATMTDTYNPEVASNSRFLFGITVVIACFLIADAVFGYEKEEVENK